MESKLIFILEDNRVSGHIQSFSQEVENQDKDYLKKNKETILELFKGALENLLN